LHVNNPTFQYNDYKWDNPEGLGTVNDTLIVVVEETTVEDTGEGADSSRNIVPLLDNEVRITNCCASSDNTGRLFEEICADSDTHVQHDAKPSTYSFTSGGTSSSASTIGVPLEDSLPSIAVSVTLMAAQAALFVNGGEVNGGFEYRSLDLILSYHTPDTATKRKRKRG